VNRFAQIAITWVAFIAMFAVNGMANYLPINGYNTGQVSAFYPNKFVPDGFTFAIWSLIYLWLLIFTGYVTKVLLWLPAIDHRYRRIVSILPLFWLTCILNALWILSWHYLQVGLSVIIMVALLATLFGIYLRIKKMAAHPRKQDHFLVEVPFLIYFGWISVAIIANITAFLVHAGWDGGSLGSTFWTIIMIFTAVVLAVFMAYMQHRPTYTLVVGWALWGIYRNQFGEESTIAWAAMIGLIICLGISLPELLSPKKGWKQNF
jgi:hypothetical protein